MPTRDFLFICVASGGFATVHPNNKLTINVIEAAPLEDFSAEVRTSTPTNVLKKLTDFDLSQAIRSNLAEALKVSTGNGTEEEKLEARIEADVYEALQNAISSK